MDEQELSSFLRPSISRSEARLMREGAFEIRIDGVTAESYADQSTALLAAMELKRDLPEQLVTLHDHRFERAWVIESGSPSAITEAGPHGSRPGAATSLGHHS